jgi:hypothetical protein
MNLKTTLLCKLYTDEQSIKSFMTILNIQNVTYYSKNADKYKNLNKEIGIKFSLIANSKDGGRRMGFRKKMGGLNYCFVMISFFGGGGCGN